MAVCMLQVGYDMFYLTSYLSKVWAVLVENTDLVSYRVRSTEYGVP